MSGGSRGRGAMDPNWRHPYGLRPTLRHLMILVVHFAVLFALAAPLLRAGPRSPNSLIVTLLLPVSPPLLALLVLVLDRPGPVKFWLVGFLASLTPAAFLAWLEGVMVVSWLIGQGQIVWFWLVPAVIGVASLIGVAKRLPRRCPDCRRRSLLPLGHRSAGLYWCASCGLKL